MSFDLPASIEREVQQYAQAEHISPAEAAVKLIQDALRAKKRKVGKNEITETELQQLRAIPTFAFFENLPDSVTESMEAASKQIRAERFTSRG